MSDEPATDESARSLHSEAVTSDGFRGGCVGGGGGGGGRPGDWIGPYKLLELLGEGGFGVVWLAEQTQPVRRRIALKVIKPGMDSRAVVARFEAERQALAMMSHPCVAKVLDVGTTDRGRPYFVMEHVKGEPITTFADRHRLTIKQRLELFIPVCDAVQHAHMKGIIHRDLKPSNILVGPGSEGHAPIVKVIDFGVAKAISHALTDKTIFTERGQLIGTPEYMSPEQAEMGATDIDTRTDVYSLGVVLYELLAGVLPFDSATLRAAGYAEIQRIIREVEAPKPSTRLSTMDDATGSSISHSRQDRREHLSRELRRELEWIPLKAMRKDRSRRYASPEALGADIRRYTEGKPLEAGPESARYLARKFLTRHKGPMLAVLAVIGALGMGFVATLAYAQHARAEEATARLQSYRSAVAASTAALESGRTIGVRHALETAPAEYRGWEWNVLMREADDSALYLRLNDGKDVRDYNQTSTSVAFTFDGGQLAVGRYDGKIDIFDVPEGVHLRTLEPAEVAGSALYGLDFVDGDSRLVVSSDRGTYLVNAFDGSVTGRLRPRGGRIDVAPDGRAIAVAVWGANATVHDGINFGDSRELSIPSPTTLRFSADGSRLLVAGQKDVRLYELAGLQERVLGPAVFTDGREFGVVLVAEWLSDDSFLVAGQQSVPSVLPESHAPQPDLSSLSGVVLWNSASIPGTNLLAIGGECLRVIDKITLEVVSELQGSPGLSRDLDVSFNGQFLAATDGDFGVRVWRNAAWLCRKRVSLGLPIDGIDLTSHRRVRVSAGQQLHTFTPELQQCQTTPESISNSESTRESPTPSGIEAYSPDSRHAAVVQMDGEFVMYNKDMSKRWSVRQRQGQVHAVTFDTESRIVFIGGSDGVVECRRAADGKLLKIFHSSGASVSSLAYAPNGERLLIGLRNGDLVIWDVERGQEVVRLHSSSTNLSALEMSQDGLILYTGDWSGELRRRDGSPIVRSRH